VEEGERTIKVTVHSDLSFQGNEGGMARRRRVD
jgi:hypothetical protein